jgi:anti-sigma factor RsiW
VEFDDVDLMLYADGALEVARRQEIEQAVANSSELAARLAALRASVLPFAAAFGRQALPEVPPGLAERVAQLSEQASTDDANYSSAMTARLREVSGVRPKAQLHRLSPSVAALADSAAGEPGARNYRSLVLRLAAAFGAGALCIGLAYEASSPEPFARRAPALVQAVSDYHELYARETVGNLLEDTAHSKRMLTEVRAADGLPVQVPDLRSAGLEFKRIQRLRFEGRPLIQLVYLPSRGTPIALCITTEAGGDSAPTARKVGQMDAVLWRHDRMAYVLVGATAQADLLALGQQIATGKAPLLYDALSPGKL